MQFECFEIGDIVGRSKSKAICKKGKMKSIEMIGIEKSKPEVRHSDRRRGGGQSSEQFEESGECDEHRWSTGWLNRRQASDANCNQLVGRWTGGRLFVKG